MDETANDIKKAVPQPNIEVVDNLMQVCSL